MSRTLTIILGVIFSVQAIGEVVINEIADDSRAPQFAMGSK